jgi:hypothetical protein
MTTATDTDMDTGMDMVTKRKRKTKVMVMDTVIKDMVILTVGTMTTMMTTASIMKMFDCWWRVQVAVSGAGDVRFDAIEKRFHFGTSAS